MKQLILAGAIAGAVVAFAPSLIQDHLQEIHPSFEVSGTGAVTVCGLEQGHRYDGEAIIGELKAKYDVEAVFDMLDEHKSEYVKAHPRKKVPMPEELRGLLIHDEYSEPILFEELLGLAESQGGKYMDALNARLKAGFTDYEVTFYWKQWSARSEMQRDLEHEEFMGDGKEFILSKQSNFELAACLFQNEDYKTFGQELANLEAFYTEQFEIGPSKAPALHEEVIAYAVEAYREAGVEFDTIKPSEYRPDLVFLFLDGEEVGSVYISVSQFPSIYKAIIDLRDADENLVGVHYIY